MSAISFGHSAWSDPKDKVSKSVRGTLAPRRGQLDVALNGFQAMALEEPADPFCHFKLGRVYHLKLLIGLHAQLRRMRQNLRILCADSQDCLHQFSRFVYFAVGE